MPCYISGDLVFNLLGKLPQSGKKPIEARITRRVERIIVSYNNGWPKYTDAKMRLGGYDSILCCPFALFIKIIGGKCRIEWFFGNAPRANPGHVCCTYIVK